MTPAITDPGATTDRILSRLLTLHPKIIDLSLDRVHTLLERMGHPERRLPPVVHVAGTNGKGSLLAFLGAILRAAGYGTQAYTSPHLVKFHERIAFDGVPIPEAALQDLLEEAETVNGGEPITFFEITTCAAFLAFARTPKDVLLLETGLGGRLDATNVVDRPALTAITPVSIDHVQYLGGDLGGIAFEKAGILKSGVPAVVAPQPPEAQGVIEARAAEIGAPLYLGGRDWQVTPDASGESFSFEGRDGVARRFPAPRLLGPYQLENAGMAIACAETLAGFEIGDAAVRQGLATVQWPGRLQPLTRGPLVECLPQGWEVWLDGGHNASAGQALARALDAWKARDGVARPLHVVFGMLNTKAAVDFLQPVAARADSLTAIQIPGEAASLTAEEAAAEARAAGGRAVATAETAKAAVEQVLVGSGGEAARVLICGSLYLAGRVLAENG